METEAPSRPPRLPAVDVLRGAVMVLMALDHVRDFFGPTPFRPEDPAATTPVWFFVRWATHFCAPVFVFLAGTSAWLKGRRIGTAALSRWLMVRGLWLMFLEVAVVNPLFVGSLWVSSGGYVLIFQVIWVIGAGFVLLSALVRLPRAVTLVFAAALVLGHNALDGVDPFEGAWSTLAWDALHTGSAFHPWSRLAGSASRAAPLTLGLLYPLVPWVGVLALGWVFGAWIDRGDARTGRRVAALGAFAMVAFLVLRATNVYGDPRPWEDQERGAIFTLLAFLRCEKYPPSLCYLLMTLGPVLAVFPLLSRLPRFAAAPLEVYGRVPLFYYLAHLAVINWFALAMAVVDGRPVGWWWNAPASVAGYEPSVARTVTWWIIVVASLYLPCRAWGRLKACGRHRWSSYL